MITDLKKLINSRERKELLQSCIPKSLCMESAHRLNMQLSHELSLAPNAGARARIQHEFPERSTACNDQLQIRKQLLRTERETAERAGDRGAVEEIDNLLLNIATAEMENDTSFDSVHIANVRRAREAIDVEI